MRIPTPHAVPGIVLAIAWITVGSWNPMVPDRASPGYTCGMKTAVSIPDDVFEEAERLARRTKRSRSEIYGRALAEYLARHAPDRVTEAMDQVIGELDVQEDGGVDPFVTEAGRRTLERSEW